MKNIVFIILLLLSPFFIFAQSNPILWANKAGGTNYEYCNSNSIAVDTNGNSYVTGYFNGSATFGIITLTSNGSYDIFVAKLDSNGNWLWAKQAGGINYDCGNSIAVDASGNIYVTGRFRNTAIFDTTTVTGSNSNDIFVAKLDSNGNWLWAKQAGVADNDCGYGIAVDASGNIYVSGWFQGVATFGYTNITSTVNSADIFVAKMDSNGNWLWVNKAGGTTTDNGNSIAVDSSGNIYVTGWFQGVATFGTTNIKITSNGDFDIFIAKLDSNGNWLWAKQAGGTKVDYGNSIAVDTNGNSYVTGIFYSATAAFGDITLESSGGVDIFVAKLDSSGDWEQANKAGGTDDDWVNGIAVDASGNSYVTGFFDISATFGYTTLINSGGYDIFVAKLDSSGNNWLMATKAGENINYYGNGIAVDADGNSYVTGYFEGSSTFCSTVLTSSGYYDIFVAKLDSSGNWEWAKKAGGTNYDFSYSIAVDTSGSCYITGEFFDYATFGDIILTSNGSYDIFVAKLDSSGDWEWANKAGGTDDDWGYGIAVDASGNSYVTGYFYGAANFGSTTLTSYGYYDIFIAKLDSSGNWLWAKNAGGTGTDGGYSIAVDASRNSYVTGYFYYSTTLGSTTLTSNGGNDIFVTKVHIPYYPAGVLIVEETYSIPVTVSGGDADRGTLDDFPSIPNQSATYKKFNFILDNNIPNWTITMQTSDNYGAYYQNNSWHVVNNTGGQIIFDISFSVSKGAVELPIILGNDNPLPVELSSFTAYVNPQNKINIMWTTQTETGLLGYNIMRSTQNELTTAHIVSPLIPATNSSQPRTYLYTDEEVTESRTYYYWLQCNDLGGTIKIYGSISLDYNPNGGTTTPSILVTELQPIYPNPFNPIAYIPYTLETKSEVKINIYNTRGQVVKTFDLGSQEKGHHRITWDGRDNDGNLSGNGIYYIIMKAGKKSFQRKAVLMKQNKY